MNKFSRLWIIFLFLILFIPSSLFSQELIALHPFRGAAENEEITGLFFDAMENAIPFATEIYYRTFRINLNNLPPDVPPGGFPPWICPSPSITRDAAYSITGEASPDQDFEGATRIRLYLWRLEGARLLGSDEMTLFDEEDLETLSAFISWVLSWITDDSILNAQISGGWVYEPNWLYLGIRGGGGYSRWTYDYRTTSATSEVTTFISFNIAFHATVYFVNFFGLQTELQINYDFNSNSGHGQFNVVGFTIPLLAKFVLRGERLSAGLLLGVSFYLPLSQRGSSEGREYYDYRPDFPGFVFGITAGWRVGPGSIFIDGRMEYDLHWTNRNLNTINYRSSTRFSIGYEIGFLPKR